MFYSKFLNKRNIKNIFLYNSKWSLHSLFSLVSLYPPLPPPPSLPTPHTSYACLSDNTIIPPFLSFFFFLILKHIKWRYLLITCNTQNHSPPLIYQCARTLTTVWIPIESPPFPSFFFNSMIQSLKKEYTRWVIWSWIKGFNCCITIK